MAELLLTQEEGDALLEMEKITVGNESIDLPDREGSIEMKFASINGYEEFILNYSRYSINLYKRNHHFRGRRVIGLARLDLNGQTHRNPDGQEIGDCHLHLYREGYGLKWAFDVPKDKFTNLNDTLQTLEDFMRYCNIVKLPDIRRNLFS